MLRRVEDIGRNKELGRMLHMYINWRRGSQCLGSERVHSLAARILCKEECAEVSGRERAPRGTLKHVAWTAELVPKIHQLRDSMGDLRGVF